jgi:hypothetical protein
MSFQSNSTGATEAVPRVSVVIPAYNAAWSIERTIASVLRQTMRDFEVIVIDDGSTDTTSETVRRASHGDPRVRTVRQENRGLAGARNRGIAEARADIVAPLDADDVWESDYLAATTDLLDRQPDAPFAFTYHYRMDEEDRPLSGPDYRTALRHDFLGLLTVNIVGCGSAAVFRRAAMLAAGGYDETLRTRAGTGAEDLKLILQLAGTGKPGLIKRPLVGYRHVTAGMSQGSPQVQLSSMLAVFDDIRGEYPETPAQAFRDARTMAYVKLLRALVGQRHWGKAIGAATRAYLANPLGLLNANIRAIHLAWLTAR